MIRAHQFSYLMAKGTIPDGMEVMHICDVPCCVNTKHLKIGTHQDNVKDCVSKNRQARGPGSRPGRNKINDENIALAIKSFLLLKIGRTARRYRNGEYGVSIGTIIDRFGSWKNAMAMITRAKQQWGKEI